MERENFEYNKESIDRLGYNPAEASDCSSPRTRDLKEKKNLLQWRYLKGGHNLAPEILKIPHVDETEIASTVVHNERTFMELAQRITGDAKQVMLEYVYVKQKCDVLRQEKDLLKWHVASNSKVIQLKESQVNELESYVKTMKSKYETLLKEKERADNERLQLSRQYKQGETAFANLMEKYQQTYDKMQEWLGRRGDYLTETTVERRQANHERKLRTRQLKKLARACAVDKKWHVRIDALRNIDNMILDAAEAASVKDAFEFQRCSAVTAPIRYKILEDIQNTNPLEEFEGLETPVPTTPSQL